MSAGLSADAERFSRGSIPSGGAGTLTDGGFYNFFFGVWLYRPSSGNSYGTTGDGLIFNGVAGAREVGLGFDNTFGGGTAGDPNLTVIFNSGGGGGGDIQDFTGGNILDEWIYYFFCADATNQYAGYIRYADLNSTITDSITRANDNATSQYINTLYVGSQGTTQVVFGHYMNARMRYGAHDLSDVMALACDAATVSGDWALWPLATSSDASDGSGNGRTPTLTGTLTTESDPTLGCGGGGGPSPTILADFGGTGVPMAW